MTVRLWVGKGPGVRLWQGGDPSVLPRNGLVALYDPYRDTYGKNCLPVGMVDCSAFSKYGVTVSGETMLETATTEEHVAARFSSVASPTTYGWGVEIKPNGRTRVIMSIGAISDKYAIFDLTGAGSVINTAYGATASIQALSDGYYRCSVSGVPSEANTGLLVGTMPDGATQIDEKIFGGDITKGLYVRNPQLNLGSTLFPYATPSGAPDTLQVVRDRSGSKGQNLVKWSEGMDALLGSGGQWNWENASVVNSGESKGGRPIFLQTSTNASNGVYLDKARSGLTVQSGKRYTLDLYAKAGTVSALYIGLWPDGWGNRLALTRNLATASPGEVTVTDYIAAYWANPTCIFEDAGDGYWHIILSADYINATSFPVTLMTRPYNAIGTIYVSAPQIYEGEAKAYVRTYDKPYLDGWHDMVGSTTGTDANDVPFNGWGNTFPGTGALYLKGDSRPLGDEWTMFVVLERTKTSGVSAIFGNSGFSVFADSGGEFYFIDCRTSTSKQWKNLTPGIIPANKVSVVAVRFSGGVPSLWVNGVKKTLPTYTEGSTTARPEGVLYTGYDPFYTYAMGGTIGRRIRVSEAMSDADIEAVSAKLVAVQAARGYPVTA